MPENPYVLALVIAGVLILFSFVMLLVKRYKRCPSNKVLVIYGKVREGQSSRCLHGGGAFVWPLIQDYDFLSLDPMQIQVPLKGALSIENIRVNVPSVFTVAIGIEPAIMNNAAIRLLGLKPQDIVHQAEDIIFGQLRQVIASMRIEDINRNRDKFLESIHHSLEPELNKIGLVLINVNITDITDESGYIAAIGKKAASEAIQQAEIDVAQQTKLGAIGVTQADQEKAIRVADARKQQEIGVKDADREMSVRVAELEKEKAIGQKTAGFLQEAKVKEAERQMRIAVADANAAAIVGENLAKAKVADANSALQVRQAEAFEVGSTREKQAQAAVQQAQYLAEARAAEALATKIEMEKRAELEAVAKATKSKMIVDAEAVAERRRIEAEGEASAIFAKLEAQARGEYEILAKKAQGLKLLVESCGGSQAAFQMLVLEHIDHLADTSAKSIANLKFDKVVVWDSGQGKGATAGFLQSLAGAIPPVMEVMKTIGGVELPQYFGKVVGESAAPPRDGAPVVAPPAPPPPRSGTARAGGEKA